MDFIKNGGEIIQREIDKAAEGGINSAVIEGKYEIEKTVIIPSGFHLILRRCHLRLAENTFCNIFRNAKCGDLSFGADDPDTDISITGEGGAVLDGGVYNGLGERNSLKDGRPHISVNNLILMANVERFEISGLRLINQRWWAMNFIGCRRGKIYNVDFCSDSTAISADGTKSRYLSREKGSYEDIIIKNSDGIDLRCGCHDIIIDRITGFTQDDSVALTALSGTLEQMYLPKGCTNGMYNVIIRDVCTAAYCANVRLLNQGGTILKNILIDGVMDASKDSPYMDRGEHSVRIGDAHLYGSRHSEEGETCDITVRNVYSRAICSVSLSGVIKGLRCENIVGFDGCGELIRNKANLLDSYLPQ
jgi:hypothetical protein